MEPRPVPAHIRPTWTESIKSSIRQPPPTPPRHRRRRHHLRRETYPDALYCLVPFSPSHVVFVPPFSPSKSPLRPPESNFTLAAAIVLIYDFMTRAENVSVRLKAVDRSNGRWSHRPDRRSRKPFPVVAFPLSPPSGGLQDRRSALIRFGAVKKAWTGAGCRWRPLKMEEFHPIPIFRVGFPRTVGSSGSEPPQGRIRCVRGVID